MRGSAAGRLLLHAAAAAVGTNIEWVNWRNGYDGELFVADSFNHVIRVIDTQVSTVAGNVGQFGHRDGVGTHALFHQPRGIVAHVDTWRIYVADEENNAVRVMDVADSYRVTTLLCSGLSRPNFVLPVWHLRQARALYVADTGHKIIKRLDLSNFGQLGSNGSEWAVAAATSAAGVETVLANFNGAGGISPGGILVHPRLGTDRSLYVVDIDAGDIYQFPMPARAAVPIDGLARRLVRCGGAPLAMGRMHSLAAGSSRDEIWASAYDAHTIVRLHFNSCPHDASMASSAHLPDAVVEVVVTFVGNDTPRKPHAAACDPPCPNASTVPAAMFSYPRGLVLRHTSRGVTQIFVSDSGHAISTVDADQHGRISKRTLASGCGHADGPAAVARFRLARAPCTPAEMRGAPSSSPRALPPPLTKTSASSHSAPLFTLRSLPRSGSTWLLWLLTSASAGRLYVPIQQEVLRLRLSQNYTPSYVASVLPRLRRMSERAFPPADAVGFSWQLFDGPPPDDDLDHLEAAAHGEHLRTGEARQQARRQRALSEHKAQLHLTGERLTVLLVRLSCLRHYVGRFHTPAGEKIDLDPSRRSGLLRVKRAQLRDWCLNRNRVFQELVESHAMLDHPLFVVAYETLQQHTEAVTAAILKAMGVRQAGRAAFRHGGHRKAHADAAVFKYIEANESTVRAMRIEDFDYKPVCGKRRDRCLFPGGYELESSGASGERPFSVEL